MRCYYKSSFLYIRGFLTHGGGERPDAELGGKRVVSGWTWSMGEGWWAARCRPGAWLAVERWQHGTCVILLSPCPGLTPVRGGGVLSLPAPMCPLGHFLYITSLAISLFKGITNYLANPFKVVHKEKDQSLPSFSAMNHKVWIYSSDSQLGWHKTLCINLSAIATKHKCPMHLHSQERHEKPVFEASTAGAVLSKKPTAGRNSTSCCSCSSVQPYIHLSVKQKHAEHFLLVGGRGMPAWKVRQNQCYLNWTLDSGAPV